MGGDCHVQVGADDDAEVTAQEQHEAAAGDVVTHAEKTFEANTESGERTESQVAVPLQNGDSLVHCEECEDTSHLHLASVRRGCRGRGWKEHFKTYDARKREEDFAFDRRVTSSRAGDARNAGGGVSGKSYFLLGLESNADSTAKSAKDESGASHEDSARRPSIASDRGARDECVSRVECERSNCERDLRRDTHKNSGRYAPSKHKFPREQHCDDSQSSSARGAIPADSRHASDSMQRPRSRGGRRKEGDSRRRHELDGFTAPSGGRPVQNKPRNYNKRNNTARGSRPQRPTPSSETNSTASQAHKFSFKKKPDKSAET